MRPAFLGAELLTVSIDGPQRVEKAPLEEQPGTTAGPVSPDRAPHSATAATAPGPTWRSAQVRRADRPSRLAAPPPSHVLADRLTSVSPPRLQVVGESSPDVAARGWLFPRGGWGQQRSSLSARESEVGCRVVAGAQDAVEVDRQVRVDRTAAAMPKSRPGSEGGDGELVAESR